MSSLSLAYVVPRNRFLKIYMYSREVFFFFGNPIHMEILYIKISKGGKSFSKKSLVPCRWRVPFIFNLLT